MIARAELAWEEQGEGRVIVFLHGFPFNRAMWRPQLNALPPGWRGIAPDLAGFGESPAPGEAPLTMELQAQQVLALLDRLEIDRAVFCGLSMGGYIAFAVMRAASERVSALVLADTKAEPDSAEARQQRMVQAEQIGREGTAGFNDGMLPKLLAEGADASVREQVLAMMQGAAPASVVRALHGLAGRADARSLLPAISVPTLVIGGEADVVTPPDGLRSLAAAIPGAQLELLAGAGHVSNMEAEHAFNRALRSFLESLR